jgi:hypothetical protein
MSASNLRGVFTISNKNNVTIQGIGFVVNGGSTAITSYGHDHLTLRDCAFTGTTTTNNGGIVELCDQSSVGGIASMTDTLIDHCNFYDITGTNARTIHLYPRDGHIVDRVTVVHCNFRNVGGPAVQLDAYDTCRGVRVLANDFINIRQGSATGGITDACAVHAGLAVAYKVLNLLVEGNYYYNDNTAITEGGLVYVYGSYNTVINGNVAIGAWTSAYTVQGPCFAPGRTLSPDIGLTITNNYVEGFNAFWDPDSMRSVTVSGNTVVRCGQAISTGYGGTQEYINYHGNVFYNCIGTASNYPGAIFLGNGNPKKCRIADNLIIDDRATPSTQYFLLLTGNFDFKDMEVSNNRFYMPNSTLTTVIRRELGNEVQPRTMRGNEVEDASGITREIVKGQGNISGATTFNVSLGELVTATLTGNTTVTLTAGMIKGQTLELRLTQDATGSRTATWPSNFKKAGGSLALSSTANAQDIITMRWDSVNWIEVSRALNVN